MTIIQKTQIHCAEIFIALNFYSSWYIELPPDFKLLRYFSFCQKLKTFS